MITGYCLLVLGKSPAYRIVFKGTLSEALKALPKLKVESEGRVEILRMLDGDTKVLHEEELDNGYIKD